MVYQILILIPTPPEQKTDPLTFNGNDQFETESDAWEHARRIEEANPTWHASAWPIEEAVA